jgi:site-specific recombinase XerD
MSLKVRRKRSFVSQFGKLSQIRFHLLRRQFATFYLRSGGSIALLSRRILGHQSLETTLVYEHLGTEDLKGVHHQHPVLTVGK